ncbi:alpha/beta hydrolase [Arenibaculum sp.]|uniref:alpha/beta hydrolase n=1 Tax=Arenibaculum sp. TaxID=2865862 RepID=UPI002E0E8435|nr:alpha/beta hydrolase [Arenibaculum sp.]
MTSSARFAASMAAAIDEIAARDGGYLSRFGLPWPDADHLLERYRAELADTGWSPSMLTAALASGRERASRDARVVEPDGRHALADWIGLSSVDAYCMEEGSLAAAPVDPASLRTRLSSGFDYVEAPGGHGAFVAKSGDTPLLLLNATGVPLAVWRQLIFDRSHPFKLVIPNRGQSSILDGGLDTFLDIEGEASGTLAAVTQAGIRDFHILAWCNGARLALEVGRRAGGLARSMALLSPMFKGTADVPAALSRYERDLQSLLDVVLANPDYAEQFIRHVPGMAAPVEWGKLPPDDGRHVEVLLGLPRDVDRMALLQPLLSPSSMANVARRVASDERQPTLQVLDRLTIPLFVLLGSHDNIISNRAVLNVLSRSTSQACVMRLHGAGHYLHDLQYGYLRHSLTHWTATLKAPPSTARLQHVRPPFPEDT